MGATAMHPLLSAIRSLLFSGLGCFQCHVSLVGISYRVFTSTEGSDPDRLNYLTYWYQLPVHEPFLATIESQLRLWGRKLELSPNFEPKIKNGADHSPKKSTASLTQVALSHWKNQRM
jgi:hypothetical protein